MSRERYGYWQEISRCKECGFIVAKEWKWLNAHFVPVCPNCGKHNSDLMGYSTLFDPVTARRVTSLEVAVKYGRDAVGFDLDERNADLARERVGDSLFHTLEVVDVGP